MGQEPRTSLISRLVHSPASHRTNGQVEAADKSTFEVLNPATGQPLTTVAHAKQADVDLAVKAARTAFKTTWGKNVAPDERAKLLNKFADLMERDQQFLAELESVDGGKGVRVARDVDIADSIGCLRSVGNHTRARRGKFDISRFRTAQVLRWLGWQSRRRDDRCFTKDQDGIHVTRADWCVRSSHSVELSVSSPSLACGPFSNRLTVPFSPRRIMMWAWKVGPALAA